MAKKNNNKRETQHMKEEYDRIRQQLKTEIDKNNTQRTVNQIRKINEIKNEGERKNEIWNIRKKLSNNSGLNYHTITEEGESITGKEETKTHVADYYENLYQAREGTEEYKNWTKLIQLKVNKLEQEAMASKPEPPATITELNGIIKKLKRVKACGPDNIPNGIFIEAHSETRKYYLKSINTILESTEPAKQWQQAELLRLDKGKKGQKGKCSGERGIQISSNMGKVVEKIANGRAKPQIKITDAQAGGIKGRATSDHIFILRELIQIAKNNKKALYMIFLDVTKAYDKAWLDAIMYILANNGVKGNLWLIIKRINENLTARIRTMYGLTREIKIKDSIRQGGVLAPMLYALMMDETNNEIIKHNLGVEMKIALQVWDVSYGYG